MRQELSYQGRHTRARTARSLLRGLAVNVWTEKQYGHTARRAKAGERGRTTWLRHGYDEPGAAAATDLDTALAVTCSGEEPKADGAAQPGQRSLLRR